MSGDYLNYDEEWKACRETSARFDGILIDLRKYGFTILTGLTTAGSFLGFSDPASVLQIGVIIVTMVLVVILYWLDIYYQNLLYGSVLRTMFLEVFRLNRGLARYVSALYGRGGLGKLLHILNFAFLLSVYVLGHFVIIRSEQSPINIGSDIEVKLILNIGFGLSGAAMLAILLLCDRPRSVNARKIRDNKKA